MISPFFSLLHSHHLEEVLRSFVRTSTHLKELHMDGSSLMSLNVLNDIPTQQLRSLSVAYRKVNMFVVENIICERWAHTLEVRIVVNI